MCWIYLGNIKKALQRKSQYNVSNLTVYDGNYVMEKRIGSYYYIGEFGEMYSSVVLEPSNCGDFFWR